MKILTCLYMSDRLCANLNCLIKKFHNRLSSYLRPCCAHDFHQTLAMSLFREYSRCLVQKTEPNSKYFLKVEEINPRRYQAFELVTTPVATQTPTAQRTCFYTGFDVSPDGEVYQTVTVRHKEVQSKKLPILSTLFIIVPDEFQILRCLKNSSLGIIERSRGVRYILINFR